MVNELEKQNILKKVDEELNEIADFIFSKSQENIVEYGAIDEATLLKSGYVNRQFLEKEIGYSAPYAGHVDFGTDPHMPPVAPLIAWVKRKFSVPDKQATRIAWAIAKTIERDGSEPRPFFRDALQQGKIKYGGFFGT